MSVAPGKNKGEPTKLGDGPVHGQPDSVQHEPSGLLRDAQTAMNLVARNPVLAVRKHPHRTEPLIKTNRRIFKDRSDLDTKLALRVPRLALPHAPRGDESDIARPTRRTNHETIWPSTGHKVGKAVIRVSKVANRFLQRLWFIGLAHHRQSIAHDP